MARRPCGKLDSFQEFQNSEGARGVSVQLAAPQTSYLEWVGGNQQWLDGSGKPALSGRMVSECSVTKGSASQTKTSTHQSMGILRCLPPLHAVSYAVPPPDIWIRLGYGRESLHAPKSSVLATGVTTNFPTPSLIPISNDETTCYLHLHLHRHRRQEGRSAPTDISLNATRTRITDLRSAPGGACRMVRMAPPLSPRPMLPPLRAARHVPLRLDATRGEFIKNSLLSLPLFVRLAIPFAAAFRTGAAIAVVGQPRVPPNRKPKPH